MYRTCHVDYFYVLQHMPFFSCCVAQIDTWSHMIWMQQDIFSICTWSHMAAHSGSTYMCVSYVRAHNWGNVGGYPGWPNIHRFMYTIDPLLSLPSLVTLMTWSYKVETALYNCPCVPTHKLLLWYVPVHGAPRNSTCTTQVENSNVVQHS